MDIVPGFDLIGASAFLSWDDLTLNRLPSTNMGSLGRLVGDNQCLHNKNNAVTTGSRVNYSSRFILKIEAGKVIASTKNHFFTSHCGQ